LFKWAISDHDLFGFSCPLLNRGQLVHIQAHVLENNLL